MYYVIEVNHPRHKVDLPANYFRDQGENVKLIVTKRVAKFAPKLHDHIIVRNIFHLLFYLWWKSERHDVVYYNTYRYPFQLLTPPWLTVFGKIIDINTFKNRKFNYFSKNYTINIPCLGNLLAKLLVMRGQQFYHEVFEGEIFGKKVCQSFFVQSELKVEQCVGSQGIIKVGIIGGLSKRKDELTFSLNYLSDTLGEHANKVTICFIGNHDYRLDDSKYPFQFYYSPEELSYTEFSKQIKTVDCILPLLPSRFDTPISTEVYGVTKGSGAFFDCLHYAKPLLSIQMYLPNAIKSQLCVWNLEDLKERVVKV